MNVLLATIVDNVNYGTYLQAYASVRILEEYGCHVDVLNYLRPHLNHGIVLKKAWQSGLFRFIKTIPLVILDSYMKGNLKRFLSSKVSLTSQFTDWPKFRNTLSDYDLYLVGSDQVWNSTHNHGVDETFYFGGIRGLKRSYASSVGIDSFPSNQRNQISSLLLDFDKISVRESFGVEALEKVGIQKVEQVLDPTLMLTSEDWNMVKSKTFVKDKPFLLVYSVETNRDNETLRIAREIAKERDLEIYLISPYLKFNSKLKVDKVFSLADTDTFLSLFSQADYAVVSSFHGTAFAINFNCQFVTVSPERFSTRVQSLLKLLNLEDRYVKTTNEIPKDNIDYSEVNKILNIEREKSRNVINRLLN